MKENPEEKPVDGELVLDAAGDSVGSQPPNVVSKSKVVTATAFAPAGVPELEGIAANGGAVGAVVLGVWSILGSLLTYWSLVNGVLGLGMGVWGLTSKRPRLAWIGIILCLVGCALSAVSISDFVAAFLKSRSESLNTLN